MSEHTHPISGKLIQGRVLLRKENLEADDVYDSASGEWEPCPPHLVGFPVGPGSITWIRPEKKQE